MYDRISYLGKAREKMPTSNFALLLDLTGRKHFTCPLIGQRILHEVSSQTRIRKTQRQNRQIQTLINGGEYTLKSLIQRSVRGVGAHKSARYVHQIHHVTFGRKPGLTVFGFITQHHLVPGPVIVSSNQRAAYCNTIS